nr:unnamed protein product [Callosobruchus analis]
MKLFEDWFIVVVLPYFQKFEKELPKVMIGDNLASHVSPRVIELWHGIRFILLTPNSTGVYQPLDVAYFRPLKHHWSKVLTNWKMKHRGTLPKDTFPRLLNSCLQDMGIIKKNVLSGFRATGIHPLDRDQVLKRVPKDLVDMNCDMQNESTAIMQSFQTFLKETRTLETQPVKEKRKKFNLAPGKSIVPDAIT